MHSGPSTARSNAVCQERTRCHDFLPTYVLTRTGFSPRKARAMSACKVDEGEQHARSDSKGPSSSSTLRSSANAQEDDGGHVTIAVEGCCHGELDNIYASIIALRETGVHIELLIICGDFQAVRNTTDLSCLACPPKYRDMVRSASVCT